MPASRSLGLQARFRRLSRPGDGRFLVVPLDHSVTDGPIVPAENLSRLVAAITAGGADAVVLHRGSLRNVDPAVLGDLALVVHLSASTVHAPDPDAKYLVTSVEGALRIGADAVSVHVNLGSDQEARQVADLALVADACDRWNLPLLAMMYPRGPRIASPRDVGLIAHAATLAADLGADLVKVPWAGNSQDMASVVRTCAVPVLVAGGPKLDDPRALREHTEDVMRSGAAGLAVGRNVFTAADPAGAARLIADVVHPPMSRAVPGDSSSLVRDLVSARPAGH